MRNALKAINDAVLAGVVQAQVTAVDRAERLVDEGKLDRRVTGVAAVAGVATMSGTAYAARGGCDSGAFKNLVGFIESAANFAIGLGAAGALLMFAVGALFIILGGTPDRASKGMKIIKNAVIGLAVLAAGVFIKFIVVNFVLGATNEKDGTKCVTKGL